MTTPFSPLTFVVRRRGRRRARTLAVLLAMLCSLLTLGVVGAVAPATAAAPGGPVIIGGDDLTDHGFFDETTQTNQQGWLYLEKALENVAPKVTRAGNDGSIAALGSEDSTDPGGFDAGSAVHHAAAAAGSGIPVTYYDTGAEITAFFAALRAGTAKPAMIWIAGNGASNDLGDGEGEPEALAANATDIADFVNSGGGLISHGTEYGWLFGLLPGATSVDGGFSDDLELTAAGTSAFPGLTNADVNAGPWHSHFEGDLGGLSVLVASNQVTTSQGAPAPVIIGGGSVVLPGSITLTPASATNPVGTTHTVTATVRDNTGGVLSGKTVSFEVTAGPNTGDKGTGTSNASGQSTFTWTGDGGPGTDTVTASFVDSAGVTRTTTATKTWEPVVVPTNHAPTADAGGPYTGTEGTAVTIHGTVSDQDAGDTVTHTWNATAGAGVDSGATCSFANAAALDTTVTCTDDGSWTLTLTADDGTDEGSDTATLTVSNANPTASFTSPADQESYPLGQSTSVSVALADKGSNDTHTCSLAWGDGSTTTGTVSSGSCTGSHTYAAAGAYTITATITDDDGGTGTATRSVSVVAPSVRVNGGGTVASPRLTFAVQGRSAGTGWTGVFNLTIAGGSKFRSTSIRQVSGTFPTATLTGTGKWNGVSGYTFTTVVSDNTGPNRKTGVADTLTTTIRSPGGTVVFTRSMSVRTGAIFVRR